MILWNSLLLTAVEAVNGYSQILDSLECLGLWGEGRKMGLRGNDGSTMNEWGSRHDGPNGLIPLLELMNAFMLHLPNQFNFIQFNQIQIPVVMMPLRQERTLINCSLLRFRLENCSLNGK